MAAQNRQKQQKQKPPKNQRRLLKVPKRASPRVLLGTQNQRAKKSLKRASRGQRKVQSLQPARSQARERVGQTLLQMYVSQEQEPSSFACYVAVAFETLHIELHIVYVFCSLGRK